MTPPHPRPLPEGEGDFSEEERQQVLDLIQRRFGIRDSEYGASRIEAAVRRVLPSTEHTNVRDLLTSLTDEASPRWLFELVQYLTVGETYFRRDPAQIKALRETILPDVFARNQTHRRLRVWSAGCSTGEEVYTLAILLLERTLVAEWDIALVGTDVNRESLRVARDALYPAWSFRSTPEEVRERYFEPVGDAWRLTDEVRRMARFAWMNLGADQLLPPVTAADLVVCRNVTIYFDDAATQRLYRTLISALAPGGWLMLGPSDPVPSDTRDLERVEAAETVLWRRMAAPRPERPRTPVPGSVRPPTPHIRPPVRRTPTAALAGNELETGLLALEAGSPGTALEWLRRATFRQPDSALAQFALGRVYVALGDRPRALAAFVHTRRLLDALAGDELVPGSESLAVATLRQTVAGFLEQLP